MPAWWTTPVPQVNATCDFISGVFTTSSLYCNCPRTVTVLVLQLSPLTLMSLLPPLSSLVILSSLNTFQVSTLSFQQLAIFDFIKIHEILKHFWRFVRLGHKILNPKLDQNPLRIEWDISSYRMLLHKSYLNKLAIIENRSTSNMIYSPTKKIRCFENRRTFLATFNFRLK